MADARSSEPHDGTTGAGAGEAGALWVMALGVLAVGSAAILFRYLSEVGPLAAAAWRLGFAALAILPWGLEPLARAWPGLSASERRRLLVAALALALHFGLWIPSLRFTSVASSVALVTTSPVFVALLSPRLLGERIRPRAWLGIALALAGALALVALPSAGTAPLAGAACGPVPCPLAGKALALGGAAAVAVYFIARRSSHARLPLAAFMLLVYGGAALLLQAAAWMIEGPPVGYGWRDWGLLVALALVPQLLGHGSFNWALARLPAALVVTAVLGEPLVGTILAWLLLDEPPTAGLVLAGLAILAGIGIVARAGSESPPERRASTLEP